MKLFELARKLIDVPSCTGDEAEVGSFVAAHLESLGYLVEMQPVEGARCNVIATTRAPARVVLSTHLDTVPPHIPSSEDAGNIYGRGACDAKGIVAAQIFAAEQLRRDDVEEVGLLFTVDEEMASVGAQVANSHPLASQVRYMINGEPTENKLAIGTKGSLRLALTTEGRAAHSAYPEQGESAIEKLLDVLESIRRCEWPEDEFFGATTCNIGRIAGGTRPNVIPAAARAELQIRLAIAGAPVRRILEEAIADRAQIDYLSAHEPVRLLPVDGIEHCVVRFTTDIPYLSNWGQALLLGPGSILEAHTDHERVSKSEITKAVELYVQLAKTLLAGAEKTVGVGTRNE